MSAPLHPTPLANSDKYVQFYVHVAHTRREINAPLSLSPSSPPPPPMALLSVDTHYATRGGGAGDGGGGIVNEANEVIGTIDVAFYFFSFVTNVVREQDHRASTRHEREGCV